MASERSPVPLEVFEEKLTRQSAIVPGLEEEGALPPATSPVSLPAAPPPDKLQDGQEVAALTPPSLMGHVTSNIL